MTTNNSLHKYAFDFKTNTPNTTWMYTKGQNKLVQNDEIEKHLKIGWHIGYLKPYKWMLKNEI